MGNACCSCFSKRDRSVDDILDGSLEDKLLGKREDNVEATTDEDEAWRQRREQLKDEADMSMGSLDDEVNDGDDRGGAALVWDLSDRNTVRSARKQATELVEDEEDEEAFDSAHEDANDDEEDDGGDQESKDHAEEATTDRLTQLSAEDSYESLSSSLRRDDTQVFRDTELDRATEVSDTFVAPESFLDNSSFLADYDDEVQKQQQDQEQQQKEEHEEEQAEDDNSPDKPRTSSGSSSSRRKKKSRSRKSSRNTLCFIGGWVVDEVVGAVALPAFIFDHERLLKLGIFVLGGWMSSGKAAPSQQIAACLAHALELIAPRTTKVLLEVATALDQLRRFKIYPFKKT